jgi:hypothetical protein
MTIQITFKQPIGGVTGTKGQPGCLTDGPSAAQLPNRLMNPPFVAEEVCGVCVLRSGDFAKIGYSNAVYR